MSAGAGMRDVEARGGGHHGRSVFDVAARIGRLDLFGDRSGEVIHIVFDRGQPRL